MNSIKLYDIHGKSTINNYRTLITDDRKYFYWDSSRFIKNELGDFVFWVNRTEREILFTSIDHKNIIPEFKEGFTYIDDIGNHLKAEAKDQNTFEKFYRFKIIQLANIPEDWDYVNLVPFNGQTMAIILFEKKLTDIEKRIEKIIDLLKLFDKGSEANSVLEEALENLFVLNKSNKTSVNKGSTNPLPKPKKTEDLTIKQIIHDIYEYIRTTGFIFREEEIANFYLSLKTKPFVILAGISGTGKTQLPRLFAQAIGMKKEQLIQIPVRPDWTDASDLLGYTSLDNKYIPKALTLAIIEAVKNENKSKPYFFILDEMNLARVEHYFSDFLSVIETRTRQGNEVITDLIIREEDLKNVTNNSEFKGLHWPENLYLIGTVNMDETTHSFSRKVLDRANTIEMNEVDLNWLKSNNSTPPEKALVDNSFIKSEFINAIDLDENAQKLIKDEMKLLFKVNDILKIADLHFAYRVRNEIAFYLIYAANDSVLDKDTALDFQLMQKILPRIHGSALRIQMVLVNLLNLLAATEYDAKSPDMDDIRKRKDDIVNQAAYKRSVRKLIFMLERFDEDRFTSYWL